MLFIAWEFFIMLFNRLVILSSVAQNNTVCHVGCMLFSCRHCSTQSVLSLTNQCIPLIIIMTFEYWLAVFAWHKFKSLEKTVTRIPKISLGFIVICFVDLGSPPLSSSWVPDLLRLVLWQSVTRWKMLHQSPVNKW